MTSIDLINYDTIVLADVMLQDPVVERLALDLLVEQEQLNYIQIKFAYENDMSKIISTALEMEEAWAKMILRTGVLLSRSGLMDEAKSSFLKKCAEWLLTIQKMFIKHSIIGTINSQTQQS